LKAHTPRCTMKSVRSSMISSLGAKTINVRLRAAQMMISRFISLRYHTLLIHFWCMNIAHSPWSRGDICEMTACSTLCLFISLASKKYLRRRHRMRCGIDLSLMNQLRSSMVLLKVTSCWSSVDTMPQMAPMTYAQMEAMMQEQNVATRYSCIVCGVMSP